MLSENSSENLSDYLSEKLSINCQIDCQFTKAFGGIEGKVMMIWTISIVCLYDYAVKKQSVDKQSVNYTPCK